MNITYDENQFLADGVTPNPAFCPDPRLALIPIFSTMGELIQAKVCENKKYTADEIVRVEGLITALSGSENLATQVQTLQDLINTLDINGDGNISELTGIKTTADDALAAAQAAALDATNAVASSAATQQALNSFQTAVNAQISSMQTSLTSQSVLVTEQGVKISALEQLVANLPDGSVDEETVLAIAHKSTCENNERLVNAFSDGLAAFTAKLNEACDFGTVDPTPVL